MENINYCKRCGLSIPKDRESNFCSDICNLMPSNFNNQEATIYRDGYNKGKQKERERILKKLPEDKYYPTYSMPEANKHNELLKQIKDIIN